MQTCFIIQPFDGGQFDKRYKDIIEPTISKLGLKPYRVDEDHGSEIPIEDIEKGIKSSVICLADISLDNPNVWYELGYAFSTNKQVIIICSKEREKFPFDIRHRTIIRYSKESPQDFEKLKEDIIKRANALLSKKETLLKVSSDSIAKTVGLSQHELITIVSIAENLEDPEDNVSSFNIKQDVENYGFTKIASVIGLQALTKKNLIIGDTYHDYNNYEYTGYKLTEKGWSWIFDNQDEFEMKKPKKQEIPEIDINEDEIPF